MDVKTWLKKITSIETIKCENSGKDNRKAGSFSKEDQNRFFALYGEAEVNDHSIEVVGYFLSNSLDLVNAKFFENDDILEEYLTPLKLINEQNMEFQKQVGPTSLSE